MRKNKIITFDSPRLEFEEWLEPGITKPNTVLKDSTTGVPVHKDDRLSSHQEKESGIPTERLYFQSFGSGSSGNCCFIGTSRGGLLVDAGIKTEEVVKALKANGKSINDVKGIVLTHDHTDHVKYVYNFLRTYKHIKLFCTNRVLNGLLRRHNVSKRIKEYHIPIFKEIPFKMLDLEVVAFDVLHDGSDNMGFFITYGNKKFALATDLGTISDRANFYMRQANYLVIESNYDAKMLREGTYPEYLKARIATDHGHMDNVNTAAFLKEISGNGLKYVFLCHISKDNNTPTKALETARIALEEKGLKIGGAEETLEDRAADIQLAALPRFDPTRWYVFI